MEGLNRPNRSDTHLSAEEEANIESKTRHYFDEVAPKRHTKPQRSEYASQYVDNNLSDKTLPEMLQFQRLENDPLQKKLVYEGNQVPEEFVETEYYKDLNSIDKNHHTTGKGFIQVEKSDTNFSIEQDNDTHDSHHSSKGNPATNDWVPAPFNEEGNYNSDKPHRSDN
ncbi:uncharacterized protein [Cicer arietinum]|uniref:Uncharacterized protein LOC101509734 n=1 Tax=Cicer arietinum TaxID=3827 RepID=A0A1S2Y6I8_CICAR|nr:uncharacterized protein LOC101509734 [Cicer arietinum]